MAWAPIAAAAIGAGAGMMGANKAAKSAKEAQKIRDKAAEQIYGINVPDLEGLQYTADKNTYAGDVNPQLLSNLGDIQSEYGNISADPRFQTAQYQSLGALDDIVNSGGMTAADKLTAQNAMNDATMQSSREQGAITRDLAERGMGGSGQELAMRMASQQGSANTQAQAAQQQAATAQQRALDAILQRGQMGSTMQGAAYDQANKAASAKDMINQFNQNNAYDVNKQNAATSNNMQLRNLDARQALSNGNTAIGNTNKATNAGAVQATYNNQMDKANNGAAAAAGQASTRQAQGESTKNMYAGIGQAAATGAGAYADYSKAQTAQEAADAALKKKSQTFGGQSNNGNTYG